MVLAPAEANLGGDKGKAPFKPRGGTARRGRGRGRGRGGMKTLQGDPPESSPLLSPSRSVSPHQQPPPSQVRLYSILVW